MLLPNNSRRGPPAFHCSLSPFLGLFILSNFEQFGTLETLLQSIDEIQPERFRVPLDKLREDLARNQKLVRLREDLPLPSAPSNLAPGSVDHEQLHALYTRWGFRGLRQSLEDSRQQDLF